MLADYEAIAHPDVTVDIEANGNDEVFISWIENGGEKGLGAKALATLCNLADANLVTISLRVASSGPASEEDDEEDGSSFLIPYYERFGFTIDEFIPGPFDGYYMSRQPKSKNPSEG